MMVTYWGGSDRLRATGQASMTARLMRPPAVPTMSMLTMGRSNSRRGYITQWMTCGAPRFPGWVKRAARL